MALLETRNSAYGPGPHTADHDIIHDILNVIADQGNTGQVLAKSASANPQAFSGVRLEYINVPNASDYLARTGGSMLGSIGMSNFKITGLGTPTSSADAATKAYVDSVASSVVTSHSSLTNLSANDHPQYLLRSGVNAMTGPLAMGNFKITGLAAPSSSSDAATKGYVDSSVSGSGSAVITPFSTTITGNASTTAWLVNHNLASTKVEAAGRLSSGRNVYLDYTVVDANQISVAVEPALASGTTLEILVAPVGALSRQTISYGTTAPANPVEGDIWLDTSV